MTLRIASITDIHYGLDIGAKKGSAAPALIDQFLDAAQAFNADYIFNLGDEISSRDPVTDEKFKQSLRKQFKRAACPILKIDGNHCARFQEKQSPSSIMDSDSHQIILWNPYMNRYTRDGVIPDPEDIDWLQNALSSAMKPTILLSHIPFSGPESGKKWAKQIQTEEIYYPSYFAEQQKLRDLIEDSGHVILCLSGHRHLNHHEMNKGVHHIIQQSLVEIVKDGNPAGAYNLIEINDREIRINGYGLKQPKEMILPLSVKPAPARAPKAA